MVLFLAATVWQRNWTSAARSERSVARSELGAARSELGAARGGPSAAVSDLPEGWSRVVIGRPSGAEPFRGPGAPSSAGSSTDPAARPVLPPTSTPPLPQAQATEVIVQAGQNLSTICRGHYGTARVEVVEAVARHNRMANSDALREGQTLDLPPLERLLPKR